MGPPRVSTFQVCCREFAFPKVPGALLLVPGLGLTCENRTPARQSRGGRSCSRALTGTAENPWPPRALTRHRRGQRGVLSLQFFWSKCRAKQLLSLLSFPLILKRKIESWKFGVTWLCYAEVGSSPVFSSLRPLQTFSLCY